VARRGAGIAASASKGGAERPRSGTDDTRTAAGARRRPQFHALTVSRVEKLTSDAVAVTFDVPEELTEDYRFRPGQALTLRRIDGDRDERRSYSICAPVGAAPRVGVREVPGGFFSSYLVHEVRPGDAIEALPPSGAFTADLSVPADHVFVVAGSGITPALSLAGSVLRDGESTVTVLYGNRRTDTVMFADELADLKDRYGPRLQLVHVLSREPRNAELTSGRLDRDRLRSLVAAFVEVERVDHWWLCGPHGMVGDARDLLVELGVPAAKVHQELFHVDDVPPQPVRGEEQTLAGPSSEVTVVLDGRTTTLALPRDVPVLDSAQKARGDLPFACKSGVCGTCRARVTHGEVGMQRNYALEAAELEAGYVLTCQAVPVSDAVTVDYDS
jgi:ring-1,2-phenylacetyl-CoA epoxidase subunit PaaE